MTLSGPRGWRLLHFSGTVKLLLSPGKAGGLPKRNYSYIQPWLSHYRSLGVERFVIVDDGSKHPLQHHIMGDDVCVVQPIFASFKTSKVFWLKLLMANFQEPGSWVLTVDIDEFLDLPVVSQSKNNRSSLKKYCNSLHSRNISFAVGLLLDMMPQEIIPENCAANFLDIFNWFYCRPVSRNYDYCDNKEIQWTFGDYWYISFSVDIRYRLFGTIDSLRKIPLFLYYPSIDLNQGYHNLSVNGIQKSWKQIFTPEQKLLPIRHYKMVKIYNKSSSFDGLLDRKDQYFPKTGKNLVFMQSIEKEYIRRIWNASAFKREYKGVESYPYIDSTSGTTTMECGLS